LRAKRSNLALPITTPGDLKRSHYLLRFCHCEERERRSNLGWGVTGLRLLRYARNDKRGARNDIGWQSTEIALGWSRCSSLPGLAMTLTLVRGTQRLPRHSVPRNNKMGKPLPRQPYCLCEER